MNREPMPWMATAAKRSARYVMLLSREERAWLDFFAKEDGIAASEILRRGLWQLALAHEELERVQLRKFGRVAAKRRKGRR